MTDGLHHLAAPRQPSQSDLYRGTGDVVIAEATFYCTSCWSTVDGSARACPACGADLSKDSERPYVDRLISALRHPLRENRMIAIQLLGDLRAESAVAALARLVRNDSDYYQNREALAALAKIGTAPAREVLKEAATGHPSALVRKYAERTLADG